MQIPFSSASWCGPNIIDVALLKLLRRGHARFGTHDERTCTMKITEPVNTN
jgi:hypothetical protein